MPRLCVHVCSCVCVHVCVSTPRERIHSFHQIFKYSHDPDDYEWPLMKCIMMFFLLLPSQGQAHKGVTISQGVAVELNSVLTLWFNSCATFGNSTTFWSSVSFDPIAYFPGYIRVKWGHEESTVVFLKSVLGWLKLVCQFMWPKLSTFS